MDVSDLHHFQIKHFKQLSNRHYHINSIERFWNQAKRHMGKFNSVSKDQFGLYLIKCEWRFSNIDSSRQLLLLRQWVRRQLKQLSKSAPKYFIILLDFPDFPNLSGIVNNSLEFLYHDGKLYFPMYLSCLCNTVIRLY